MGKIFKNSEKTSLSALRIALLYCGVLMGAGFASGKEMWQFFGVFGGKGFFGIAFVAVTFVSLGFIIVSISRSLNTGDLSKIILPFDHSVWEKVVGGIISVYLFMAYFSMLAAGGALCYESFGIHRLIGSFFLMMLVVLTAIKGFIRVSDRLGKTTPILLTVTLFICLFVIFEGIGSISWEQTIEASPLSGNWIVSSFVFLSYNMMGAIPILGSCSMHTTQATTAKQGAVLGGIFLGIFAITLCLATMTNPSISSNSPLPLLSLTSSISTILAPIFAIVLLLSIFGTATSCFYGLTTKFPAVKRRNQLIWAVALSGYGLSMVGFSNIVAFLYPIAGYLGMFFLLLMLWNYYRIKRGLRG